MAELRSEAVDLASAKINGSFPLATEEAVAGPHYATEYFLAAMHNAELYLQKTLTLFPSLNKTNTVLLSPSPIQPPQ